MKPFVVTPRLIAANQLAALPKEEAFAWHAVGDDPQFMLRNSLLLPGWHMLEVEIKHDQPSAAVKIYFDMGEGESEETSVYLPLKDGRVNKRLIHVPLGLKKIRFDPLESGGRFTIRHLRFVWLMPQFAHDRLAQRLVNMHFKWRGYKKNQVLSALKKLASKEKVSWRKLALQHYDSTFERHSVSRSYHTWIASQPNSSADQARADAQRFDYQPLISVVLPVYNPPVAFLKECLDSVLAQYYPYWQLCVADDASTDPAISKLLADYAEQDPRIHVVSRKENGHICAASNSALKLVEGAFIALLDHDDVLAPEALFEVAKVLQKYPDAGLIYSDEDKLNDEGERYDPHFKPDWNPDLLLAQNYLSHLGVYRTDLVNRVGGFREGYEGSQDHDLALRVSACLSSQQIIHIPKVLYHWRAVEGSTALNHQQKDYAAEAGLKAVNDYLTNHHAGAIAVFGNMPNTYRVHWPLPDKPPLVSLLIPTRDRVEILKPCVDAILSRTDYRHFELLILDNESTCPETLAYMQGVKERDARVNVLRWEKSFNYSAINNFGVKKAKGSIIGLVNNDIEPINPDWLTEMVSQVCRPGIGCVGAKLYYPNNTIQHAGVILGIGGVAGHAHKYFNRSAAGYFSRLHLAHNLSAVTAACLLVRKEVFEKVEGLNEEHLSVAFNDVDLCLKVREAGYRNLWTPYAELYHHESVSRGADNDAKKRARAAAEVAYMRATWAYELDNDPAYSPNLTLAHEDFSLR